MADIIFTPYERTYRNAVKELLAQNFYVHAQLDWYDSDEWLSSENVPARLAWQDNQVVGILALSPPLHHATWVRLAAVLDKTDPQTLITALWRHLYPELLRLDVRMVALLMIRDWIQPSISALGFTPLEQVITLRRSTSSLAEISTPTSVNVRSARLEDIPFMAQIDQAAFTPPWQLSSKDIRAALRHASHSTVIESNGEIKGYQISTLYFDGGHLARLAIDPDAQGQHLGSTLVHELLRHFQRRSVFTVTVNTQETNQISQHLYHRFQFQRNGYDLPVWIVALKSEPDELIP